jgi:hypothetical protein
MFSFRKKPFGHSGGERFGSQNRNLLHAHRTIPHNRIDVGKTIKIPVKKLFLLS